MNEIQGLERNFLNSDATRSETLLVDKHRHSVIHRAELLSSPILSTSLRNFEA